MRTSILAAQALATALAPTLITATLITAVPAWAQEGAVLLAAGDIATCAADSDSRTAAVVAGQPGTIAALGALVYHPATDFAACYRPTWGPFTARTRPTPGEHEYENSPSAAEYFSFFGAAAAPPSGYYSYDLGSWHIIVLNSNCDKITGGCATGGTQERWLRADLSASRATCTLAYFHEALFSSGTVHPGSPSVRPLFQALYDYGAEVVLNSENRQYERFAPQAPDGRADPAFGIREFNVGTGGHALTGFGTPRPNSEVRNAATFGVLKLTLGAGTYAWQFLPIAGQSFAEAGSGGCHGAAPRTCLVAGTDATINAALAAGGANAQVRLCPGAFFTLDGPVRFTAPGQHLFTEGLPTDATRATLRIRSPDITTAVDGNNKSGIILENVQVDGARPQLGYRTGAALIEVGASSTGQVVRGINAYNTRSWSTLHIGEGIVTANVPECQRATIVNNTLGPAGVPTNVQWADGISLACGNSLVQGNVIRDATDGGIVIFGAPGSRIVGNSVIAQSQPLFGGINLVDIDPVGGNYTGVLVSGNIVEARAAPISVGFAMGPGVWYCKPGRVFGATVANNAVIGRHAVYGFAADGVTNWTMFGNTDHSQHPSFRSDGCGGLPVTPTP